MITQQLADDLGIDKKILDKCWRIAEQSRSRFVSTSSESDVLSVFTNVLFTCYSAQVPPWVLRMGKNSLARYMTRYPRSKHIKVMRNLYRAKGGKLSELPGAKKKKKNANTHTQPSVEDTPQDVVSDVETDTLPEQDIVSEAPEQDQVDQSDYDPEPETDEDSEQEVPEEHQVDPSDYDPEPETDEDSGEQGSSLQPSVVMAPRHPTGYVAHAKRLITHHVNRVRHKIVNKLKIYKSGLKSINKMLKGERLTNKEKHQAKQVAKLAGMLLIGAIATVGAYTTLGPFAHKIGTYWFNDVYGSDLSDNGSDSDTYDSDTSDRDTSDRNTSDRDPLEDDFDDIDFDSASSELNFDGFTNVEAELHSFNEEEDDDDWPVEEEMDDGHSDADSLLNAMSDWLAKQDVPTLVSKLERLDG